MHNTIKQATWTPQKYMGQLLIIIWPWRLYLCVFCSIIRDVITKELWENVLLSPAPAKRSGGYGNTGRPSVHPRYVVNTLRFLFVDQFISNLHTSIILGISSISSKLGKISKCYNFNENWYLEDFRLEECDSDKCNLKMAAIAAIMLAILAAIFNMVAKTHKHFRNAPITKKIDI